MKKFSKLAALAFAATAMLATSCSKENTGGGDKGDGTASVMISFSMPEGGKTRAEGDAATATTATFQPGHILFVTGSGMIDRHVTVGKVTPISGVTNFTIAELTTDKNVVVENVSSSATKCYILSNDTSSQIGSSTGITSNLEGQNISQVLGMQIAVNNINSNPSTLDNVPMYGVGDVDINDAGNTTVGSKPYTATVEVEINSLASRIQIGKITAKDYSPANSTDVVKIKSFTVDGIYISNTYDKMTPASAVAAAAEIDNGSTVANYSKTGTGTDYNTTTGTASTLADEPALAASVVSTVLTADQTAATKVWAYNVFPKGTPHIIVKLSNITYTITSNSVEGAVQTITGTQWLTIDSYKKSDNTVLAAFEANNIYTLADIAFDYADLTDVPETTSLAVLVNVEMFDWVETPLTWND